MRCKALIVALGAAAMFAAPVAQAQDAQPSARQLELARRLFNDMHMDQMMAAMTRQMAPAMTAQMRKSNPNISAEQAQAISEAAHESMSAVMPKLIERMIPLYATTLTQKELEDTVAFYEGPSGKAILAKLPQISAQIVPIMTDMMPEMTADMQRRVCAKIDCSKQPSGTPGKS